MFSNGARYVAEFRDSRRAWNPDVSQWKMRDFVLFDPSGVLWRIAEKTSWAPNQSFRRTGRLRPAA